MESELERNHHEAAIVQVQLQSKIQLRNHPAESTEGNLQVANLGGISHILHIHLHKLHWNILLSFNSVGEVFSLTCEDAQIQERISSALSNSHPLSPPLFTSTYLLR